VSAKAGAEFAVMLIGSKAVIEDRWEEALRDYPETKSMTWDFEFPFTAIRELGQRSGFGIIDLAEAFREDFHATRESRSWPHDGHWNPGGNHRAAELVAQYLLDHRAEYHLSN
jgi:hypothetical protein